eukprot:234617-Hanusia_phi.AAC.1
MLVNLVPTRKPEANARGRRAKYLRRLRSAGEELGAAEGPDEVLDGEDLVEGDEGDGLTADAPAAGVKLG